MNQKEWTAQERLDIISKISKENTKLIISMRANIEIFKNNELITILTERSAEFLNKHLEVTE